MNAVREGVCLVGLLVLLTSDEGRCALSPQQRADIDTRLSHDMATPPFYYTGNLTEVDLQLVMTNVRFSDENMADFTFYSYQIWRDERLAYPDIVNDSLAHHVVRQIYFDNIWLVESYVENELHSSVHDSVLLNRFVWIFPNGTIVYSMRLTVGLACNLQAIQFPIGEFICNLKYRIHSYSKDLVLLNWSSLKPIVFTRRAQQESVDTKQWRFSICDADDSAVIKSSCLEMSVVLVQDYRRFMVRLYMPSIFVVFVGWLSFWIDRSQVSARIKLGTLCLLAMITEEVGIKFLLPTNIQLDAVDVWFCANLVFVLIAIMEYTFVHAVDCYQEKLRKEQEAKSHVQVSKENGKSFGEIDGLSMEELQHPDTFDCDRQTSYDVVAKTKADETWLCWSRVLMKISTGRVEKYARLLYAIAFVVFQIFYWVYYLNYKSVVQPSEPDFDVACTGD
ncbi:gamma-aminobutyric acid receptor subunit rho-3-like [Mizuhopecten yessoensis]|uniref:Glutamate-gated chloride channel n=1 Tax=Mizuhopecten yessoensis TaxID=6573 RepID=A0A210PG47_MIZYE|nr:gamma-aminobutyric acid receptor subunit rho-3-like [Mizuhopecten yessoensis]OWF35468.1 Glutamate-gated chloride channel [Mizuhopecten yessoensis]